MNISAITIEVDEDAAKAFESASPEERGKLRLLLGLRLKELVGRPVRPLREVMDQVGLAAEERGLTAEVLDSLLKDG